MQNDFYIDDIIDKGIVHVNVPPVLIIFVTGLASLFLDVGLELHFWFFPIALIVAVIVAWLIWSRRLMQWRIWAFSQVSNVHELQKRAEQKQLLWPKNSLLYKIEFKFKDLKPEWQTVEPKFEKKDSFIYNPNIPEETVIMYSQDKSRWNILGGVMILVAGIVLILGNELFLIIPGILAIVLFVSLTVGSIRKIKNKDPQLIISDKGIYIVKKGLFAWADIQNDEAFVESRGRKSSNYLRFQHAGREEKIYLDDLDIDIDVLNKLLIYYRLKSENNVSGSF